ncbi:STAS domain-containing protein [Streptomyces sp. SAJ15]|uniref:STAS domain-containing protein n=1 Tax=Streptomyces sp. SAJ15 TaxID=2011095 RepID=UPI0021B3DCD4|nr:STAS domain-containing protein [Streptomyces sp. SAJ15]
MSIAHEHVSSGVTTVTLTGDFDVYAAPELREVLVELISPGHQHLIIDMEGVEFFDSTNYGVLVGAVKRLRPHDGCLVMVCTLSTAPRKEQRHASLPPSRPPPDPHVRPEPFPLRALEESFLALVATAEPLTLPARLVCKGPGAPRPAR